MDQMKYIPSLVHRKMNKTFSYCMNLFAVYFPACDFSTKVGLMVSI